MLQKPIVFGVTIPMYKVFNYLAAVVLVCYFLSRLREYTGISPWARTRKRPVLAGLIQILVLQSVFYLMFSFLNPQFGRWFTHGNANYYGNLVAWVITCALVPPLFKTSTLKASDVLSPALPLSLFVAKLACFFQGCCSSFEVASHFYYNQENQRFEFPVQLVEAGVALVLFFVVLWFKKRRSRSGFVFPFYLTAYSVSRFFTEFLRDDFPNVLGPLDAYQIMSIVFTVLGAIMLCIVWKYGVQIDAYFEKKFCITESEGKERKKANGGR